MSHDYDDDLRTITWFLAGMGVGATVALLFAPKSGKETRRLIARNAERSREYLEDTAERLRDRGKDLYDKGRDVARDARDMARDIGEEASDLVDRGRKIVKG
jgi:gas vesicle protein